MLKIVYSGHFKKDLKLCGKRRLNLKLLEDVIHTLRIPEQLGDKYRPHILTGDYAGFSECHIQPDWLLVYKQTDTELLLARTGTHSDLFR